MKHALLGILLLCSTLLSAQNLFLNEWMASNESTITDPSGEFADWIEIYNAGNSPVDLAGYYLSDDPADPFLSQIPATDPTITTIPANGYLILWADKDEEEGPLHLGFKLGSGGETVQLTAPDGSTVVDLISFGTQTDDISEGRSTDGASDFVFFNMPSPGTANEPGVSGTFPITISIPVIIASDDAEEFPSGGVTLSSSDLELVQDGNLVFTVGCRFQNVPVPAGAVINAANIQFTTDEASFGSSDINIAAEQTGDAPAFANSSNNLSNRNTTNTVVNWQAATWPTVGAAGPEQATPDLTNLVQEIVDRPDWADGNAMVFLFTGSGTRVAEAYEGGADRAAVLHIEASVPLSTTPIPTVFINEISAEATTYEDESGKREDWIELYNPHSTAVDIGNLYLTDDYDNLDKWQISAGTVIPSNGYITFFADEDEDEGPKHTNFKLKAKGEQVALVQLLADGPTIIDSLSYGRIPFLATYGRSTDGGSNFQIFGSPTPENSNNNGLAYLSPPEFSLPSGSYTSTQSLMLSHPESGVTIYYTDDGSLPTTSDNVYTDPINISGTSGIRAIAVKNGFAESQPEDQAYLINENKNLPVLYLTTDPDNFFDDEIGIYVDGTNGVVAYCASEPVNWARDWERPANLKLFMPDGSVAFDVNAGVEISGACSRNFAMKSLAINLREKVFGDGSLDYELFPQRDLEEYQRLKIRNSGQDYIRLGFRDMVNQTLLFDQVDIEVQAGRTVLLYLNGEFWGIHNLREKYSGEHFEELYGVKEKDIDIIKSPGLFYSDVKKGFEDDYNALFDFVEGADMNNDADYDYFDSQVDVNEFTNYWIAMTYMANYDWPANNLTVWRDRVNQTKWRYGVADTDGSTDNNLSSSADPDFNTFALINEANSTNWPNNSESTLFLRKLLDRDEYRDEFIQRNCTFSDVIFDVSRTQPLIDSIVNLFRPNVAAHLDNWAFNNAMGGTEQQWDQWIVRYENFWRDRPDFMRQHLNDFYNLNGYFDLTINVQEATNGRVVLHQNEMEIPFDYTGTYFKNIPMTITAIAEEGYAFSHWVENGSTNPVLSFTAAGDATLTPVFIDEGNALTLSCPDDIVISTFGNSAVASWNLPVINNTCSGNTSLIQTAGPGSNTNFPIGTTTISYEVTNDCGQSDNCSFTVTVNQSTSTLSLDCPANINATLPPGSATMVITWNTPAATTNCPNGPAITQGTGPANGSNFGAGQTTISYQATDECGNIENCSFTVTINETATALILDCPENINTTLPPGVATIAVNWNAPTATANCPNGATITQTAGPANGSNFGAGQTTISYQATDECGNIENCSFTVTINETATALTLDCPENIDATLPPGVATIAINWNAPTATTNCPNGTTITQTAGPANGSNFGAGQTTISYQATDECGNIENCSFVVNITQNNSALTIDCPSPIAAVIPAGNNSTVVNWTSPATETSCGGGMSNSNCGQNLTGYTALGAFGDHEYFLSTAKVTWPVAQAQAEGFGGYLASINNAGENDFLQDKIGKIVHIGLHDMNTEGQFEWISGEPLTYTNFTGTVNNSEANDYGNLAFWDGEWDVYSDLVRKTYLMEIDCAGGSTVTLTQTGGPAPGSALSAGTYQVSYEASDECGNVANCSFSITVTQGEVPPSNDYCENESEQPWQQYIGNVTLNTINNNSGKSKYSDFTYLSTSLVRGSNTGFSLTPNFSYTHWDEYVRVWIDLNGDNDFFDPNELVLQMIIPAGPDGNGPGNTGMGTINIPQTASTGATRMRVAMQQDAYPNACGGFIFGEVEDYTINIVNSANRSKFGKFGKVPDQMYLFPNPATNWMQVELPQHDFKTGQLTIVNMLGQIHYQEVITEDNSSIRRIELGGMGKGIYLVYLKTDGGEWVEKLMVR